VKQHYKVYIIDRSPHLARFQEMYKSQLIEHIFVMTLYFILMTDEEKLCMTLTFDGIIIRDAEGSEIPYLNRRLKENEII